MMKQSRQFAIRELITSRPIRHQEDLRVELRKKGFTVTQATLSRDLQEIGVGRTSGTNENGGRYVLQPASEVRLLEPVVGPQIVSIAANESLIVIRTLPGCASVVGEYIDALGDPDVIGTLAGDNTLLVIPSSVRRIRKLIAALREQLLEGQA